MSTIVTLTGEVSGYSTLEVTHKEGVKNIIQSIFSDYTVSAEIQPDGRFSAIAEQSRHTLLMLVRVRIAMRQYASQFGLISLRFLVDVEIAHACDQIDLPKPQAVPPKLVRNLERIQNARPEIRISVCNPETDAWLCVVTKLMDHIVTGWSVSQMEALEWALQGMTQQQIAQKLNITQPSVNNRLRLALWSELEYILKVWEWNIDLKETCTFR